MQMRADMRPRRTCDGGGLPTGDRTPRPAVAEDEVLPPPEAIPTWSEPTVAKLNALTALQRSYVQWVAAGYSGAEAYRRASKRTGKLGANARNNAVQIARNIKVREAIDVALMDTNLGARMERAWMLMVLREQIDVARASDDHRRAASIPRLIRLVAELQGELPWRPPDSRPTSVDQQNAIRIRIRQIVAEAKGLDGRGNPPVVTTAPAEPRQTG
jgi:hypothetical protein